MSVWFRGVAIATALIAAGAAGASSAGASLPKHTTQVTVHAGHTVSNIDASLTAGSAISGQVTDGDSNPLDGAQVYVLTATGQEEYFGYTDSNGDFRAVGLPPTTKGYAVCVNGAGATSSTRPVAYGYVSQCNGSMSTWYAGSKPPGDARLVTTSVGQASIANLILPDGGALTGTVTSRVDGSNVSGAGSLFTASGRAEGGFSVSDGGYTDEGVAPGTYVVCFNSYSTSSSGGTGLLPQCYNDKPWPPGSPPPSTATTVTVTSGAATEVDQSLPAAAAITGKVRNASTHSATSAAVVVVYAHGKALSFQYPDSHGTYVIQNLPVETVDVCAFPEDGPVPSAVTRAERRTDHPAASTWPRFTVDSTKAAETGQCWKNTPWSGRGSIPGAARELHLTRGVTTSGIDLAVSPMTYPSHITGHVRDAAGGLKNAQVAAFSANGSYVNGATSGKGGAYRLNVPASAKKGYIVCAGPERQLLRADALKAPAHPVPGSECWRKTAWNGSGPPSTGAPRVTVASGHTKGGIDITLPKAGTIAGTVVTQKGAAVRNAEVTVFDPLGDYVGFGETNAQGLYKVTGLSPAKGYVVCFSAQFVDVSTLSPDYGLRSQCYSDRPWDGNN